MKKIKSILIIIFSISIIFSIFNIGKVLASVNTIKITNVQIKEKSTGVDASIVSYDNDDVKANVEYHKVNDYVIFNVTLKNNDTKKYTIKTITDDNLNGNIVYEYDKHENEEFNSNEEKVLEIKSTYKTEVNNMDKRVVNNSVKFNIIFVDEDGNESSKVVPINPKTGDNIGIYLLILIVSLVGLLSITIQKNKKIRSSLLIALLLIPITAQAANLNFIISFNENIKLYDKLLVKINGEEKIIPYNSKIDKPENPSKPGYTFDNWYSGNEVFDFTKEIKEDTTITPKFNIITYNINYDYAGGTATNPTTYTVEDKITLNNPTKEGYTFAGWTGTGITTQTTSVTIQKGSTEDRSYVAHFSTNQNTKYTVVHKYQKLNLTDYETEEVEEHGATNTEVAAPRKPKAGFETPEEQNVKITGDGKAKVTYVYNRKTYTLNVTDRTYLDSTSTANGTYPYETQITLKTQEREGYTFKWNDNDTNYTKSFKLTENKELTPIYTANQNTKYTVVHKYQKLDPTQYETEEVEEHGTTDETVPASRKPKTGFETPEEQNIKITGDGEAKVTYVYNRKTYTFTINDSEYVDSTKESGNYPYETQITISPKERAGFTFTKWSDNTTDNPKTITLASNVTISPVYEANELDFNGDETISKVYSTSSQNVTINPASNGSGNYTYTITEGNTNNYFSISGTTLTIKANTPASEYTIKIKAKDNVTSAEKIATFKITITKQQSDAVTNLNVSPEGIVSFTNSANADGYLISIDGINYTPVLPGSETTTYNYLTQVTAVAGIRTVYVKAINNDSGNYDESDPVSKDVTVYKLSINVSDDTLGEVSQSSINVINGVTYASSENKLTLSDEREITTSKKTITGYTITFDGWSLENGTISQDTTITANYSKTINKYTITFNSDGGSEISDIKVDAGDSINELPTPTKDGSIFIGWFENVTDENPVTEPYTPSGDIELIAKWQKMICKKATTLHTETCNQTDSTKFCIKDGFANGDTITYGNIVSSDTYTVGDALDCDVDGTGYNQRFYYLRTNDNKAVLISNTNYTAASGQSDINSSFIYSQAHDQLPTISEWSNLTIKFDGKPARLITIEDILTITGASNASDLKDTGSLKGYEFLFENSNFSGIGERSTQWVEEISSTERYRYRNDFINLAQVDSGKENTSKNPVRPVIEVPVELIKDDYIVKFNPNGGIVSNKYANIQKGEKIGTLPTVTRNDYIFAGWYTSLDFTIPVNENTIPNGYVTYYAKWLKPVEEAQLEHDSFNLNIDESKTINVLNSHELENYTFTSSNNEIVSVTNAGVITGVSVGEATITMRGTVSDTTKEIHVNVQQEGTTYNVEFDSQGGEKVESINVDKNTAIGILPVTTKENKLFVGWYTSLEYTEKVAETTIIDSDKKYYARWADADDVAEMNNEFYKSIQTAVNTAPTTKTTITLLQDVSINAFINMYDKNTNKDIVLDLNNHTLTGTEGQTIRTKIPLEIKNGTVIQTSANGTIDLGPGGHLIINSGRIENSGGKAAIYNDGGTVEIGGDVYLTSNAEFASGNKRGTVQNKSGTTIITGGTIINTRSSSSYAVAVSNGTFTLGTQDGIYNTSSITLQGNTSGIYSDVNYSVYDGVIKGKGSAVNLESKITSTEANSTKINTEEEIESVTYKVLYYNIELSKYEITLNPDGGEVNPTLILVDQGNKVGTLPTPSKGIYTFDGWYNESNEAVDENTVPTKNETYTAKWVYDVNPNVVSFRTTPDAQKTYYQYIDTWKNSSSNFPSWSSSNNSPNWPLDATENTVMMQNFNNNNCMCADNQCSSTGTVHCDKPKGYNTGVNGKVSVYTYNETSGEKDTKVTYAKGDNGVIYNLIPDKVYYWELDSDENVHGLVKFTSERRIIDAGDVLNVRDLGGLPADTDGDNIPDATLAYGRLFRGIKLNSSSSITELTNLGINSELDLREANSDAYKISRYNRIEAQNYFVNPNGETDAEKGYYTMTRNAVKYAMEEIVAGNNLYYHCRIGTDRTGTVSYVLEGLLGVPEEDRVQDYELSFFYGLVRIHRYHNEKPGSNVGTGKERFVYMHDFMPTNSDIYNWYMQGTTNQTEDEKLIEDFKNAMIEK